MGNRIAFAFQFFGKMTTGFARPLQAGDGIASRRILQQFVERL